MASITFDGLTAEALIRMGDALLAAGANAQAREAFDAARPICPPDFRASLEARFGFIRYQRPGSTTLLGVQRALEQAFPNANAWVSAQLAVWNKINSFLDDPRLMAVIARHERLLPFPNWHWNFQAPIWAINQVRSLSGSFVELGVFRGHTTLCLAEYFDFGGWDREWLLYDTFTGIPEDQLNPGWDQANRDTYEGTFSFEEVQQRFSGFSNIHVIQGRVPEILADRCPDKIAFLHMDLNSAVAEVAALDALFERLVPGGVIVFDDYCWAASIAQHKAEKAWFAARGLAVLELPTGQGVFVKP